jgi:two-component system, chemotaxis family, protein-glutamate methylesterase/glutaminase
MKRIIVIGASAGGIDALSSILPHFNFPEVACLIVIHLPAEGPNLIPEIYKDVCPMVIKEAEPGEELTPGTIYVAPPDYHLCAELNGTLSLNTEEPIHFCRPAIDMTMDSIAKAYREKVIGILLTGSNNDGAMGMQTIHRYGGVTLIQNPHEAEYPTMPQSCLTLFEPTSILSLKQIPTYIFQLLQVSHEET